MDDNTWDRLNDLQRRVGQLEDARLDTRPCLECEHPFRAVYWNPLNGTVQCHRCGQGIDGEGPGVSPARPFKGYALLALECAGQETGRPLAVETLNVYARHVEQAIEDALRPKGGAPTKPEGAE